jgi:hypothetical protein
MGCNHFVSFVRPLIGTLEKSELDLIDATEHTLDSPSGEFILIIRDFTVEHNSEIGIKVFGPLLTLLLPLMEGK